jgi:hypothetical protein
MILGRFRGKSEQEVVMDENERGEPVEPSLFPLFFWPGASEGGNGAGCGKNRLQGKSSSSDIKGKYSNHSSSPDCPYPQMNLLRHRLQFLLHPHTLVVVKMKS